ncbi:hypothetical protein QR680_015628 [Steinernema hermaphroditum]|uniref:Uncharacterized protein n=1 Tax=Steinernema hermaphroditum TaxID=289476 RepID=A0AA39H8F3_9BILA|nr:hypothetical protein QR680_015618 [Steinernema hermaphroditum]KAK0401177.1 hypothetical protein QR680_015628 [Steinernema hermaphroditum]
MSIFVSAAISYARSLRWKGCTRSLNSVLLRGVITPVARSSETNLLPNVMVLFSHLSHWILRDVGVKICVRGSRKLKASTVFWSECDVLGVRDRTWPYFN